MLRYAITNRALFAGEESEKRNSLLRQTFHWVRDGFDFIQLREKDLSDDAIAELASEILEAISATAAPTRLLINSRVDVAVATRAHGVHLTTAPGEMTPDGVRRLYASARLPEPVVSVSCHTLLEVEQARENHGDLILFSPVFGKSLGGGETLPGQGLGRLKEACEIAAPVLVFALGGVTAENAAACGAAGAAGIAGIGLFHKG